MTGKVIFDKVVVKPLKDEQDNGIIEIPESARIPSNKGEIIMVGGGHAKEPMIAKVGDKVLYSQVMPIPVEIEGVECFIIRQSDILLFL